MVEGQEEFVRKQTYVHVYMYMHMHNNYKQKVTILTSTHFTCFFFSVKYVAQVSF